MGGQHRCILCDGSFWYSCTWWLLCFWYLLCYIFALCSVCSRLASYQGFLHKKVRGCTFSCGNPGYGAIVNMIEVIVQYNYCIAQEEAALACFSVLACMFKLSSCYEIMHLCCLFTVGPSTAISVSCSSPTTTIPMPPAQHYRYCSPLVYSSSYTATSPASVPVAIMHNCICH